MTTVAFPDISKSTRLHDTVVYSYVYIKPKDEKPWILFLHGFPSSSYDWRHQIAFFSNLGYGILAPDLLGYGGTDKPIDVGAYRLKKMSEEVIGIVDAEGVDKVVGVGHDWGCGLLSRLANYFPDRFIKFCFLSVGYVAPHPFLGLEALLGTMENLIGYPAYAYWVFFNDPDAAKLIDRDVGRASSLFYCGNHRQTKEIMCQRGATRSWFADEKSAPLDPSFLPTEQITIHQKIFDPKSGGYGPALNWYKAQMAQLNNEDESGIPHERWHIRQETLAILGRDEFICIPELQVNGMQEYVQNLKVVEVKAGHWLQLQIPDVVNKLLHEFLEVGTSDAKL